MLEEQKRPPPAIITPEEKCFLFGISIECVMEQSDGPSTMELQVFRSMKETGDRLVVKKTSSLQWQVLHAVELIEDLTFVAILDETENMGSLQVVKTDLDEIRKKNGSHNRISQKFETQSKSLTLALSFYLVRTPLDVNSASEGSPSQLEILYEATRSALATNPGALVETVLSLKAEKAMKSRLLKLCGDHFLNLFRQNGDKEAIELSSMIYEMAARLMSADDPLFRWLVYEAAQSAFEYHVITGQLSDVNATVSKLKAVVQMFDDHECTPWMWLRLGTALLLRSQLTGSQDDISTAIAHLQEGVQLIGESDLLPNELTNLALAFFQRFEILGDYSDISEAISAQKKAISLTSNSHPDMAMMLKNFGGFLTRLFELRGDLTHLSEGISLQQKALSLTSEHDPDIITILNNIGLSLTVRFQRSGNLTDILEAISYLQKALHIAPEDHEYIYCIMQNLGKAFLSRFRHTRNPTDLSESIFYNQRAVDLHEGHPDLPTMLVNLGTSFTASFDSTNNLSDLSKAISLQQKALILTPNHHALTATILSNIGGMFWRLFTSTRESTSLSEAISHKKRAIELFPEGHSYTPRALASLAGMCSDRAESTRNSKDVSEAISYQQEALALTPHGHASIPGILVDLGSYFRHRFEYTGNRSDIHEAAINYRKGATSASGPPSMKVIAAKGWVALCWEFYSELESQLMDASTIAIDLALQIAGLEETIQERHRRLPDISDLSTSAAAAALKLGRNKLAAEWLEQSRCIIWRQLNSLRTPVDDLRTRCPDLADDILRVSRALEQASARQEGNEILAVVNLAEKMTLHDEAITHLKLSQEWDELLAKVRAIKDFEDFLRPQPCSTLLPHLPESGTVVFVNIHKEQCDAITLLRHQDEPIHIHLPKMSYATADGLRNLLKTHLGRFGLRLREGKPASRGMRHLTDENEGIKFILHQLWILVVKPILDALGYSEPSSDLRRIWWCATGPLAFLPIHAAGIYEKTTIKTTCTLSDFAISSYTPTLRALVDLVKDSRVRPGVLDERKTGLLMISQPNTPHHSAIPGTTTEVRAIERLLKNREFRGICLTGSAATVNQVLTTMESYSCLHLACHASQDYHEPLKTGFSLHDGKLELLSVIRKRLKMADLAFLSACQTSTGDDNLSEEAIHLAAGMLAAGYRGVVATMWSIQDQYGPEVAEDFYTNLLDGAERLNGENAARALHYAIQNMRERLGASKVDLEASLLAWVPYIHFGL